MIKEFCSENHVDLAKAISMGAQRIELCDNLAVGGTTPSYGVVKHVCQLAHENEATVMTMIRPRGGDFCYDEAEVEMMVEDCKAAIELGSDGLVYGLLTEENWLDEPALERLFAVSQDCQIVFHMAFDQIPRERQFEALDWLAAHGVTRILTRGSLTGSALNNVDWLQEIVAYAQGKLEILIGGGLTADNVAELLERLPIDQVHGTRLFW
ncbi:TPA: copper homeostasis protein CutC [Streptococcus suis]|nr:copper homeostasis protein CutC [Streptococcus suis]HEP1790225.1 copper homeostasis protein CutC [Streptococcus suis]HEP1826571.1 copper homeostasis protein CutC [Streptococcus suis]HEP1841488.1 copper homeostasis protein CutC [Streptococcus suis]